MLVKKLILFDSTQPDGEQLWKIKSCSFLGLAFLFCFIHTRSITVIKTWQN